MSSYDCEKCGAGPGFCECDHPEEMAVARLTISEGLSDREKMFINSAKLGNGTHTLYAKPPNAVLITPDQRQALRIAIDITDTNGWEETCKSLRALLAASMGGDRS